MLHVNAFYAYEWIIAGWWRTCTLGYKQIKPNLSYDANALRAVIFLIYAVQYIKFTYTWVCLSMGLYYVYFDCAKDKADN